MSGYSYSDEIAASLDLIEKWCRQGKGYAAATEVDHLRKLVSAELGALLEEVRDAEKHAIEGEVAQLVRDVTQAEQARIRSQEHNQRVTWERL